MSRVFGSLLLVCALVVFADGASRLRRLAGGVDGLGPSYQPYMVAIKYKDNLICSGSIIGPTKILTAANCVASCLSEPVPGPKDCEKLMTIYAGSPTLSNGGKVYNIKSIKIPDDFTVGKFSKDIAVLTLTSAITYSDKEKPIALPDKDITDGSQGLSSGWGLKSEKEKFSEVLQILQEKILISAKCNEYFKEAKLVVDSSDFCGVSVKADKAGLCVGDSGSPLVQDGKIIGVSSWGVGCARGFPDVYTNVFKNLDFVKKQI